MIRAVFDTNVLASAFVTPLGTPGRILAHWSRGTFELVVSEHILTELAATFEQPYFARRLTPRQRAANLALLRSEAALTTISDQVQGVAPHPEDDLVLATAVSAAVEYLVTGDERFRRRVRTYQGVALIRPRDFLQRLADP